MTFEIYQRTLDFLRFRKRAYQLAFPNPAQNEALKDLAKFCHVNEVYVSSDLVKLGASLGRREVWLRIQHHLNLQPDELYEIYNRSITQKGVK